MTASVLVPIVMVPMAPTAQTATIILILAFQSSASVAVIWLTGILCVLQMNRLSRMRALPIVSKSTTCLFSVQMFMPFLSFYALDFETFGGTNCFCLFIRL